MISPFLPIDIPKSTASTPSGTLSTPLMFLLFNQSVILPYSLSSPSSSPSPAERRSHFPSVPLSPHFHQEPSKPGSLIFPLTPVLMCGFFPHIKEFFDASWVSYAVYMEKMSDHTG